MRSKRHIAKKTRQRHKAEQTPTHLRKLLNIYKSTIGVHFGLPYDLYIQVYCNNRNRNIAANPEFESKVRTDYR